MPQTRKATLLHFIQATIDPKVHHAEFEPIPEGTMGAPPKEWKQGGVELEEWNYALKNCPVGMLRSTDRRLLISWCEICAEYDRTRALVRKHGNVITTPNGMLASSPYVTQRDKALQRMRLLAEQLGFSPAARGRVSTQAPSFNKGAPSPVNNWGRLKEKTESGAGADKAPEAPAG